MWWSIGSEKGLLLVVRLIKGNTGFQSAVNRLRDVHTPLQYLGTVRP